MLGLQRELLSQLQDTMQLLKEERNITFMALRNISINIDKWKKGIKRCVAALPTPCSRGCAVCCVLCMRKGWTNVVGAHGCPLVPSPVAPLVCEVV